MFALITTFAVSLFLLSLFFAIKEREVYSGTDTMLTRVLRRFSPGAQAVAERIGSWLWRKLRAVLHRLDHVYEKAIHYGAWGIRAFIVMIAQRMIHAVRGEQLLTHQGASSMYLKHLKEHKDNTAAGAPQV
jgi:hypothetical protein